MGLRDKIKKPGITAQPQSVAPPKMPDVLSEPPAPVVAPAPAAPVSAPPASEPARTVSERPAPPPAPRASPPASEAPAPVAARPAPAAKASVPAAPAVAPIKASAPRLPPPMPAAAPAERDDTPLPGPLPSSDEGSGAQRVSVSELIESSPPPAPASGKRSPLAGLDLATIKDEEQAPAAPQADERKSEPPPSPKVNKGRKGWAFDAENDEGASMEVVSGYRLKYMDKSPEGISFRLKGAESVDFTLGLDENQTHTVDSPDGPVAITVANKGLNGEGSMEVEVSWEGGQKKVAKAAKAAGKAAAETGKKTASAVVQHSAEIAVGLVTAAVPIAYFAFGGTQLREAMGNVLYYIGGAGVPAVMAALGIWRGVERRSEIREETAEAAKQASK